MFHVDSEVGRLRQVVLVGMSERTTPQAVEVLAGRLFAAGAASCLVAIDMPKTRAFMHLDTLLTMADYGVFTKYAGMGMLPSYTVEPGATARELKVTDHPPEDMHRAVAAALGLPAITVLTAVQDVRSALREQWDDGCNVLAVEPRVVIAYERNVTTNTYLQDNGIEVITVPGGGTRPGQRRPALHDLPHRTRGLSNGEPPPAGGSSGTGTPWTGWAPSAPSRLSSLPLTLTAHRHSWPGATSRGFTRPSAACGSSRLRCGSSSPAGQARKSL